MISIFMPIACFVISLPAFTDYQQQRGPGRRGGGYRGSRGGQSNGYGDRRGGYHNRGGYRGGDRGGDWGGDRYDSPSGNGYGGGSDRRGGGRGGSRGGGGKFNVCVCVLSSTTFTRIQHNIEVHVSPLVTRSLHLHVYGNWCFKPYQIMFTVAPESFFNVVFVNRPNSMAISPTNNKLPHHTRS